MAAQLTPWFPGDVKPARVGVYERDYDRTSDDYNFWDGAVWHWGHVSIKEAAMARRLSNFQDLPWRGLANPPEVA